MFRVMRQNVLQEDEGHHHEYDLFETRESAQKWVDSQTGYFEPWCFYVVDERCPAQDAFNAAWNVAYPRGKADGFTAGAEAMREAAATHIEAISEHWDNHDAYLAESCAEKIRALPLPEPPK